MTKAPKPTFDPSTGQLVDEQGTVIPENQWRDSWKQTWDADKKYLDDLSQKSFWDYAGIPLMAAGAFTGVGALNGAFGGGGSAAASSIPESASSVLPSTQIGTGMATLPGTASSGGGMGFLSTLKDIVGIGKDVKDGIGLVTGNGGKPGGSSIASDVGQTAGSIASARLQALIAQTAAQQRQDANNLTRSKLALEAPGMEAGNAVRGDVLANSQDASISGLPSRIQVPTISGGLRPSLLSSNARQLGANMSRQAMLNNLNGSDVPELTPLPKATAYDGVLGGIGQGAGFLNAIGGMFNKATNGTGRVTGFDPNPSFDANGNFTGPSTYGSGDITLGDTNMTPDGDVDPGDSDQDGEQTADPHELTPEELAALLKQYGG